MNSNCRKLFGAIGTVEHHDEPPAFLAAGADPDFSRWYTQQWLKCEGYVSADLDGQAADGLVP